MNKEMKILLVGTENTGKFGFYARYVYGQFLNADPEDKDIKDTAIFNTNYGTIIVSFCIDTIGSIRDILDNKEEYDSIILFIDAKIDQSHLVHAIQYRYKNIPFVICQSFYDRSDFQSVLFKYPTGIQRYPISAKSNHNTANVLRYLMQQHIANDLVFVDKPIPTKKVFDHIIIMNGNNATVFDNAAGAIKYLQSV